MFSYLIVAFFAVLAVSSCPLPGAGSLHTSCGNLPTPSAIHSSVPVPSPTHTTHHWSNTTSSLPAPTISPSVTPLPVSPSPSPITSTHHWSNTTSSLPLSTASATATTSVTPSSPTPSAPVPSLNVLTTVSDASSNGSITGGL
ncbi:hypothetical protein J3R83DRAFT_9275 [Lanmaoa asiatica]|nr:hypothetical protein J3R83DRAFT_9275 [Lanmaoa asiatica]